MQGQPSSSNAPMTPAADPGYAQMIDFQHPTRGKLYMWFQKVGTASTQCSVGDTVWIPLVHVCVCVCVHACVYMPTVFCTTKFAHPFPTLHSSVHGASGHTGAVQCALLLPRQDGQLGPRPSGVGEPGAQYCKTHQGCPGSRGNDS